MADDTPFACSLEAGDLERRLAAIAEIGTESLVSRQVEDGHHLLCFRPSATTRERLEAIVAAEAECCSFLDLALDQEEGALRLSIAAPSDAQGLADYLAEAFAARPRAAGASPLP